MKPIKIKFKNKEILVNKDFMTTLIGFALIVLAILLSGIMQLGEMGFNADNLKDVGFWSGYFTKLLLIYLALFGSYIIRRMYNRQTPKFITQRETLKEFKEAIVKSGKIQECKNWLKNVYNYRKKVEIYQNHMLVKYEKSCKEEPIKPIFTDDEELSFWQRYIRKRVLSKYNKKLQKWKELQVKRGYYQSQIDVCETHLKIIEAYVANDEEKVNKLKESIKEIDGMNDFQSHFKPITFEKLFNVDLLRGVEADSIDYNENKHIAKKILPSIFFGLIIVIIAMSIFFTSKDFSFQTVILILLNILLILFYSFNGIRLADNIVFGVIFIADSNRITICEQFKEDSKKHGDNWIDEEKGD